jgi:hypothetical protein
MNNAPNQRRFSRLPVQLFVEIRHNDICLSSNKTHDVSMKGLFVHTRKTLPIGAPCQVKLMLEGSQEEQSIDVCGRVVRVTNIGMGVEFYEAIWRVTIVCGALFYLIPPMWLRQKQNSMGIQVSSHTPSLHLRWLSNYDGSAAIEYTAISDSMSS